MITFILNILIVPLFLAFFMFSVLYTRQLRTISFIIAVLLILFSINRSYQFEYGISHNPVVVIGNIVEHRVCVNTPVRGPSEKGFCATVSYQDKQKQQYEIELSYRRSGYFRYDRATVVYDNKNPHHARVIKLDNTPEKFDSESYFCVWIVAGLLFIWGILLQTCLHMEKKKMRPAYDEV